jgi:hypothetical protein
MMRRGLVREVDPIGQLLNTGLAAIQRLEQCDPGRLRHHPKALRRQLDNVFGK